MVKKTCFTVFLFAFFALQSPAGAQSANDAFFGASLARGFPFLVTDSNSHDAFIGASDATVIACNKGDGSIKLFNPLDSQEPDLQIAAGDCGAIKTSFIRIQILSGSTEASGRFWLID